jgi:cytochrome c biogenesis protein CcmG, thiol:disulfide interchange protein DsbE
MSPDPDDDWPADPAVDERQPAPAGGWSGGRRTMVLAAAVVLAVLVGAGMASVLGRAGPDVAVPPGLDGQLLADRPAPDERMLLPDATLEGFAEGDPPVALATYRGRPLVVNFWASWCAPCVAEMPDLQQFHEQLGSQVALLGVNVTDAPRNAQAFVEQLGITYDLARDPDGALYRDVRGFGMPTTLFVDASGTVVHRRTGMLDADQLRGLAAAHLGVEVAE